jgi:biotin/methionine sulfoxide reductase
LNSGRKFQTASHWGAYTVEVAGGRIVGVEPIKDDPHPSALIAGLVELVHSPLRVTCPHVRRGYLQRRKASRGARGTEPFVPVSWDVALRLVEEGLREAISLHGNESIYGGSYGWASAGRLHHAPSVLKRFLGLIGGYVDKRGNHSFGAAMHIAPYVIGRSDITSLVMPWRAIADHAQQVVLFGGMHEKNTQVDAGGAVLHENSEWISRAARRSVRFVNVSPARGDTPAALDPEWLPIVPNTDVAMMLGLAHTLIEEGLHCVEFLQRYCVGFEALRDYLIGVEDGIVKDANWASSICGVDAQTIRQLARSMATKRTLICVSWSVQRAEHGEQPIWMAIALASMLGQIGRPGCGFSIGIGAVNGNAVERPARIPRPTMPLGDNPVKIAVPVGRVADMLLNPGEVIEYDGAELTLPDIKIVYSAGGNPFHHNANLNRFVEAWRRPDLVVVNEPWWNPAARFADIVLPVTTTLERNDILAADMQSHYLAMYQALPPFAQARNDYDIFSDLADRFDCGDAYTEGRDEMQWLRQMYTAARAKAIERGYAPPEFDEFWEVGRYAFPNEACHHAPLMFEEFRRDPAAHQLRTPSGKIELYSATIDKYAYPDCPPHPSWLEPTEWCGAEIASRFPLHLLSHQPATRLHSQLDPSSLSRACKRDGREVLTMHPRDATSRQLDDGDLVEVFNERGSFVASLRISDQLLPGVVQIATGAWFDPAEPGSPQSLEKHGNPNAVTSDRGASRLSQSSTSQTVLVDVVRCEVPPPPVTAFCPPQFADGSPDLTFD